MKNKGVLIGGLIGAAIIIYLIFKGSTAKAATPNNIKGNVKPTPNKPGFAPQPSATNTQSSPTQPAAPVAPAKPTVPTINIITNDPVGKQVIGTFGDTAFNYLVPASDSTTSTPNPVIQSGNYQCVISSYYSTVTFNVYDSDGNLVNTQNISNS